MADVLTIDSGLLALMEKARIGDQDVLKKWLTDDMGVDDRMSFALLASDEKEVHEAIVKASGITDNPRNILAAKKLWHWSRESMGKSDGTPSAAPASNQQLDDETPLGKPAHELLQRTWLKAYCFHIPGMRLVVDGLFNSMFRQIKDSPKRLAVPNLENVKLQSATVSYELKGTLVTSQGAREFTRPTEVVTAHHDLWLRINAICTSI